MILDLPPKLILPDHYQANRPAIIRPLDDALRGQLPAVGGPLVSAGAPIVTYLARYSTPASGTSYTSGSLNFGPERADRLLVAICSTYRDQAAGHDITGINIAGSAATVHIKAVSTATYPMVAALSSRLVPAGPSGTVQFFCTSGYNACIDLYSVTGYLSATPFHVAKSEGGTFATTTALSLNVPPRGAVIYTASIDEAISAIPPGLTLAANATIDALQLNVATGYRRKYPPGTGIAFTATHANGDRRAAVAASWR